MGAEDDKVVAGGHGAQPPCGLLPAAQGRDTLAWGGGMEELLAAPTQDRVTTKAVPRRTSAHRPPRTRVVGRRDEGRAPTASARSEMMSGRQEVE